MTGMINHSHLGILVHSAYEQIKEIGLFTFLHEMYLINLGSLQHNSMTRDTHPKRTVSHGPVVTECLEPVLTTF